MKFFPYIIVAALALFIGVPVALAQNSSTGTIRYLIEENEETGYLKERFVLEQEGGVVRSLRVAPDLAAAWGGEAEERVVIVNAKSSVAVVAFKVRAIWQSLPLPLS
jgi:hypothetical protein